MKSSDHTPPDGLPAALRKIATDQLAPREQPKPDPEKYGDPVTSEVHLGGITPRVEEAVRQLSGDLYLRLEGQISGPFRPDRLESLLVSGILTGLEEVSADLNHWTPLAYHPRIVRGRVRDLRQVHLELRKLSELPATKDESFPYEGETPLCAIVRKPRRHKDPSQESSAVPTSAPSREEPAWGEVTEPDSEWNQPEKKR